MELQHAWHLPQYSKIQSMHFLKKHRNLICKLLQVKLWWIEIVRNFFKILQKLATRILLNSFKSGTEKEETTTRWPPALPQQVQDNNYKHVQNLWNQHRSSIFKPMQIYALGRVTFYSRSSFHLILTIFALFF